jgi:hypothetical protein
MRLSVFAYILQWSIVGIETHNKRFLLAVAQINGSARKHYHE